MSEKLDPKLGLPSGGGAYRQARGWLREVFFFAVEDFQQTLRPEPPPEVVVEPPSLAEQTIRPDERPLRPADLSYLSALLEGTQDLA